MIILLPDITSRGQYEQAFWKYLDKVSLWKEARVGLYKLWVSGCHGD